MECNDSNTISKHKLSFLLTYLCNNNLHRIKGSVYEFNFYILNYFRFKDLKLEGHCTTLSQQKKSCSVNKLKF